MPAGVLPDGPQSSIVRKLWAKASTAMSRTRMCGCCLHASPNHDVGTFGTLGPLFSFITDDWSSSSLSV